MTRAVPPMSTALLLAAAACSTAATPTGRYLGTSTPTALSSMCQPSKAVAQIRDGVVIFAPDEGTWVLEGAANPNGNLTADHSRIGANNQPYDTSFEANWTPTTITGTYKTPRCTYHVELARS